MNDELDDINLLKAFQQKDAGAEKAVFERLFTVLCLYAEDFTGYQPAAEDIVSEALLKAWDRRDEFDTFPNLQRFLYRVVRNACIDYSRTAKHQHQVHAQLRYLHGSSVETGNVLDNEIVRADLLAEIYAEIEQLPDRCGQIFKLVVLEGRSTSEVAGQLSLSVQTVRNQKARAIELLKTQLLKKDRIGALLLLYTFLGKM